MLVGFAIKRNMATFIHAQQLYLDNIFIFTLTCEKNTEEKVHNRQTFIHTLLPHHQGGNNSMQLNVHPRVKTGPLKIFQMLTWISTRVSNIY